MTEREEWKKTTLLKSAESLLMTNLIRSIFIGSGLFGIFN